jgi:2-oxoglutarate dehydrogenase E1 component
MEVTRFKPLTREEKLQVLDRIFWTDEFNQFIAQKYNTMKRFGLEGCESLIPGMKTAMDTLVNNGCENATIGMAHRGRLSMMANVLRKPLETIFAEFQGVMPTEDKEA